MKKKFFFSSERFFKRFFGKLLSIRADGETEFRFWHVDYILQTFLHNPMYSENFSDFAFENPVSDAESPISDIFSGFRRFSRFFDPSLKSNRRTDCIFGIRAQNCVEWHVCELHLTTFIFVTPLPCTVLWIMARTWWKNESHQMGFEGISFDAVLRADSKYTLCSAISVRWVLKNQEFFKKPF
jgi:hypothetical protein